MNHRGMFTRGMDSPKRRKNHSAKPGTLGPDFREKHGQTARDKAVIKARQVLMARHPKLFHNGFDPDKVVGRPKIDREYHKLLGW